MFGVCLVLALAGCVRSGAPGTMGIVAASVKPPKATEGPYRDLDAAVRFAAAREDMAILEADASDPAAWRYTLVTTRDENVALTINLPPDPDPAGPVSPTSIDARIGFQGSPEREKRLVEEIEGRLEQLQKTGIAPGSDG